MKYYKKQPPKEIEWHDKFVWFPKKIYLCETNGYVWVWLEKIRRYGVRTDYSGGSYKYNWWYKIKE